MCNAVGLRANELMPLLRQTVTLVHKISQNIHDRLPYIESNHAPQMINPCDLSNTVHVPSVHWKNTLKMKNRAHFIKACQ